MSATRVRDWATIDYYAVLGVAPTAGAAEIATAYRARAKASHPDATDDADAHDAFHDVTAAYSVLSNPRQRREYDRVRGVTAAATPIVPASRTKPAKPSRWTPRRAWIALVVGALVALVGVAALFVTWHLHQVDADQRARFIPVTAQRIQGFDGEIGFDTRDGRRIVTNEPRKHGEGTASGPTVAVRYDPADPEHVIVDANSLGRDITFAIVGLKLLVGGLVFAVLGGRYLRGVR